MAKFKVGQEIYVVKSFNQLKPYTKVIIGRVYAREHRYYILFKGNTCGCSLIRAHVSAKIWNKYHRTMKRIDVFDWTRIERDCSATKPTPKQIAEIKAREDMEATFKKMEHNLRYYKSKRSNSPFYKVKQCDL